MPFFKYIVTKTNSSDPWIIAQSPYAEAICTEEEINSVIIPFRNNVNSLPGFTSTDVNEIDSTNISISYNFDSEANRDSAIAFFKEELPRKNLLKLKREEANLVYTANTISG
jgi:hypothetical protein